jgi:GTP-binding protein HflX
MYATVVVLIILAIFLEDAVDSFMLAAHKKLPTLRNLRVLEDTGYQGHVQAKSPSGMREKCIIISVESLARGSTGQISLPFDESLKEMAELCSTAGLSVVGTCTQRLPHPHPKSYLGEGKLEALRRLCLNSGAAIVVVDDDITPRQQRTLESVLAKSNNAEGDNAESDNAGPRPMKVLDRTAVILDIFAQHAQSREGQLQVELALMQYRSTRGPNVAADMNGNSDNSYRGTGGAGLRGPGETKLELDKRKITTRIELLQKEIKQLENQRKAQRQGRARLGAPLVALVGYTNAGKSTVLNRLTSAGVLAENMLFATLDPTTRKVRLPVRNRQQTYPAVDDECVPDSTNTPAEHRQGMEIMLTDTVGFISKLPSHIVAAFRATLESLADADVLVHVCDRSNPAWERQRAVVNAELERIAARSGRQVPVVEFWNKLDQLSPEEAEEVRMQADNQPIEMSIVQSDVAIPLADVVSPSSSPQESAPYDDEELSTVSFLDEYGQVSGGSSAEGIPPPAEPLPANSRIRAGTTPKKRKLKKLDAFALVDYESLHLPDGEEREPTDGVSVLTSKADAAPPGTLHAEQTQHLRFTAAGSAATPGGLDDLLTKLERALTLRYKEVECFVPFSGDQGITSMILTKGVVLDMQYLPDGVAVRCSVPVHVADLLLKYPPLQAYNN